MTSQKKKERRARVLRMIRVLDTLFPKPAIALHYSNHFELLVAVILSAQCTDKRVNEVTKTLFKKYPTLESYVRAKPAQFERDIHSCGFFRNKTKSILGAARELKESFDSKVPETMEELLSLPGVARKTANVVLSNAYGIDEGIAIDTHVRRFTIRFDLSDYKDPVRIEKDLMEITPKRAWGKLNHQLVLYGREFCTARKHDCTDHPLTKIYPSAEHLWPKAH